MTDREKFYDEHIAPALLEIAKKCRDNGLSIVATVQFGPELHDRATTRIMQEDASLSMVMVHHCAMKAPNIDAFMIGLARHCDENGIDTSASMYLSRFDKGANYG